MTGGTATVASAKAVAASGIKAEAQKLEREFQLVRETFERQMLRFAEEEAPQEDESRTVAEETPTES